MNKDEKSKTVSDVELSLISAISGLDNKLEELDHNLAMMTKSGKEFSMPNINENEINKKILDLEEKLTQILVYNLDHFTHQGKNFLKALCWLRMILNL